VFIYARIRNYPRDQAFRVSVLGQSFARAFLSLLTPVIIVGGILFGLFTPTEAAIAACFWALFLGLVVYRTLTWRRFLRVSFDTIETTAVVLFIVGGASIFAWILTSTRVTEQFAALILTISENPIIVLLLINLILILVGCFLETVAAITILVPVLLPIVVKVGVDPVHFGVIMVLNLMIGLLTPPIGMVLYVLSRVAKLPFERCVAATAPFLVPLVTVLLLVTLIPGLSMWLPTLIYR
jgi:tripartite ATP-independent transporter DctM subunit